MIKKEDSFKPIYGCMTDWNRWKTVKYPFSSLERPENTGKACAIIREEEKRQTSFRDLRRSTVRKGPAQHVFLKHPDRQLYMENPEVCGSKGSVK